MSSGCVITSCACMTYKHCKLKVNTMVITAHTHIYAYIRMYVLDSLASVKQAGLIEWTRQNCS